MVLKEVVVTRVTRETKGWPEKGEILDCKGWLDPLVRLDQRVTREPKDLRDLW